MAYEAKTRPTDIAVADFIAAVSHPGRRADAETLVALFERISGEPAVMWGGSIVGFGRYHYRYATGHEGDAPLLGFSPRKANMVIYAMPGERRDELLSRLGKHRSSVACLYVNRLSDINLDVLAEMAAASIMTTRALYPS